MVSSHVSIPALLITCEVVMKEMVLTKGQVSIVDDEDYEFLSKWKWSAQKVETKTWIKYYAVRRSHNGKPHKIYMHREITKPTEGFVVDHINGYTLDNRKLNLRICTQKENSRNQVKSKSERCNSKYKGVSKIGKKWRSLLMCNYKCISLGVFENEIDAAKRYDEVAKEIFGEFAILNFRQGDNNVK